MDWIEQDIAIGNFVEVKDMELLEKASISSALSLDGTLSGVAPQTLKLKKIEVVRLEDGPGDLRLFKMAVSALEGIGILYRVSDRSTHNRSAPCRSPSLLKDVS